MSKDQMESELKKLKDLQSSGNITLQREKEVINQISQLEKSIPYATPLDALQKEFVVLKKNKDALGTEMNKKWTVLNALNEEISAEKATLEAINGSKIDEKEKRQ